MFDYKFLIWEFNNLYVIFKKKLLIVFCILLLDCWNRDISIMYIFFLVFGIDKDIDVYFVLEE